ncbi:MAG: thiolase C-terminal domain-containing protein [Sporichthyaceae bacterium]
MRTLRAAAAVVGVGQTPYYKRGQAPCSTKALVLAALIDAAHDAGIDPRDIDGFSSWGDDSSEGTHVATALGIRELRWSSLAWGGGGGGQVPAILQAAAAVATGQARCVAVYRGINQAEEGRMPYAKGHFGNHYVAHGILTPVQLCALRTQRMLEHDKVPASTLEALALAGYHHAQTNPRAVAHGAPLDAEAYRASRLIAEPLRLYDCSRENDGAAAILVMAADRARETRGTPAWILGGVQGFVAGWGELTENDEPYTSSGLAPAMVERLWRESGVTADDVDVTQVYENFTGPAVAALIDIGLVPPGPAAGEVMTVENLTLPHGRLPVNTAGGNLAEGFVHGIGVVLEAVRQIRGGSPNPVPNAQVSLLLGGPAAPQVGAVLFGADSVR